MERFSASASGHVPIFCATRQPGPGLLRTALSSVAEALDSSLNGELDCMSATNNREGRVVAWQRLQLLKDLQTVVERGHA